MISSLLSRELLYNYYFPLNIAYIPSTNNFYEKFMSKLGHFLFTYDSLYMGVSTPDLCITNNKLTHIDSTINICQYHQINLIIIDHEIKSEIVNTEKILNKYKNIPNVTYVAANEQIKESWDKIHSLVLNTNTTIEQWNELLYSNTKKRYIYE